MTEERKPVERKAYDPSTMGYGKHDFRTIDPSTINPDDYARKLEGEEQHFGEVREYNCANNQKHPENDLSLDWASRIGTVFETDAPGYEGQWVVVDMPVVKSPHTYCRVKFGGLVTISPSELQIITIDMADLGIAVDETNNFKQVRTKIVSKGKVDREQRQRLTKR